MEIKSLIQKFIANLCERNYAEANKSLHNILESKLKQRIAVLIEKKSSPAQKAARKKFLEKIKAKKGSAKKKGDKKEVTEEGFEKKPFDAKGFKKLYAGEKSGSKAIVRNKKSSRESSENAKREEEHNSRKDALKKSSKNGK